MGLLFDLAKGVVSIPGAIGNGIIDLLGTGVASARDLGSQFTTGKSAGETEKWQMYRTGAKNARDARLKTAGRALNGVSGLVDLALMFGTGGTSKALTTGLKGVAVNGMQGLIGGAANELAEHGENYDKDRALKRAISGAATGAITSGVGNAMSKAITSNSNNKLLNNFITRNNIGRGVAMGALGGGVSGAMIADANNQDILGGALSGIGGGALMGGAMSGTMGLGAKLFNKSNLAPRGANNANSPTAKTSPIADTGDAMVNNIIPQNGKDMDISDGVFSTDRITPIEKRNKLQKIGNSLKQSAKNTKYSDVYSSLYPETADKVAKNNTLERLSKLGVAPQDYKEYAKTSSYVNEVVDRLAEKSKVFINDANLPSKLTLENITSDALTDGAERAYNRQIKKIIADGPTPDKYSAAYLLKKSREFGKFAEKTSDSTLHKAYTKAKYIMRDTATEALEKNYITGDDTTAQIANGLKKIGASQKIIDYYSEPSNGKAPSVADYIRRTSLFEEGRTIGRQMESNKLRRSASEAPTGVAKTLLNAAGLMGPLETLAKNTISPIAGGITHVMGGGIERVGNALNKSSKKFANHQTLTSLAKSISANPEIPLHFYNILGRTTGREITNDYQNYIDKQIEEQKQADEKAKKEAYENRPMFKLDNGSLVDISMVLEAYEVARAAGDTAAMSEIMQIGQKLAIAEQSGVGGIINDNAAQSNKNNILMKLRSLGETALQYGDMKAFAQVVQLYKMAEAMYGDNVKQEKPEKLSDTQKRALAAENALNELENINPNFGYRASGTPLIGGAFTTGGNDYESKANSLESQMGYMMSGASIGKEEREKIRKAYIPQPFDSEETIKRKLKQAKNIIQQYKQR